MGPEDLLWVSCVSLQAYTASARPKHRINETASQVQAWNMLADKKVDGSNKQIARRQSHHSFFKLSL